MSTTFDVYPRLSKIPSFRELLDLSSTRLNEFLANHDIKKKPVIEVALLSNDKHAPESFDMDSPAKWSLDCYAWFQIEGVPGGTDAYCWPNFESEYDIWRDEIATRSQAAEQKALIEECLANELHWSFRRSAGQPAIINVAYGVIAASLTELTDGFIYSADGAWDYERFPARAQDFFSWYFRPEMAIEAERAEFAERCIKSLLDDLEPRTEDKKITTWLSRLFR